MARFASNSSKSVGGRPVGIGAGASASAAAARWLDDHPNSVVPYARERILDSPRFVDQVLSVCLPMGSRYAFDAGSGAGYDTFALADRFGEVLAIDTDRDAVRAARRVARGAGVNNIEFICGGVERVKLEWTVDCLWCNGMSHYGHSRMQLLAKFMATLEQGGWLVYAEVTEGFAIKEIARTIAARDAFELRMRVQQVIAGLLGTPGFRFFASGSAERELGRLGLTVAGHTADSWNGLPVFERVWGTADQERPASSAWSADSDCGGDYTTIDPELASVRACAQAYTRMRRSDGVDSATELLRRFSKTTDNRLAPLILVFELAELLSLTSTALSMSKRLLARLDARSLDWSRAGEVNERIVALARANSSGAPSAT